MPILCRFRNNIASISVVCGPTVTKFVSPSTTIIVSDLTFVLDFRFSSPWGTAVLNVLRFGPKIGEIWGFTPHLFQGHFQESHIAKVLLVYVAKFRKCRLSDVEKSVIGKK